MEIIKVETVNVICIGIISLVIINMILKLCSTPTEKAMKVLSIVYKINDYKRAINTLLVPNMSLSDYKKILSLLNTITRLLYNIIHMVDENTVTEKYRSSIYLEIVDITDLVIKIVDLIQLKEENILTTNQYDYEVLVLMKMYRPIYIKIHHVVKIKDLIL